MFNYICLDNIAGINKPVYLDFKAIPRKKEKKETIYNIERGVSFNKLLGIIGGNASGKTSIVRAICAIGSFIGYRAQDYSKLKGAFFDNVTFKTDIYEILPKLNDSSEGKMASLEMDIYIPNGKKPGYYTYYLKYTLDRQADIKTVEKLDYRKKFNSNKENIFDISQNRLESELGYKYNYRDTILEDYKNTNDQLYWNLFNKLEYYETFYNYYINDSSVLADGIMLIPMQYFSLMEWIEKDPDIVNSVVRLVDKKIKKVTLEENNETKQDEIVIYGINDKKMTYKELSTGTQKVLYIVHKSLNTIKNNGILICDEIENSLHLDLVKLILKLFSISKSQAQIIFTTNNENVMDEKILRNDQIYCIARDCFGNIEVNKYTNFENTRYDSVFKINYRRKEIYSEQPNEEDINKFVSKINEMNF